jgi:predicted nucleotidyltransferase
MRAIQGSSTLRTRRNAPLTTRRESSPSAGAVYLDREERLRALREAAQRAKRRLPTIRRVVLFGSMATGMPGPRSDADLLVELTESPTAAARDRIPDVLGALSPLPCPVDLFVLTSTEVAAARRGGSPLLRAIEGSGVDLLVQDGLPAPRS